ncbi:MAG TPA: RDD family protein [Microbacterium sp.]|uniref:RDD family protein n=1 Tax=Microbacterium sp. TaxID=51671 RepID=UPI002BE9E070|nr:RDD family protein [Microbacterium sp.]HWI29889.1 RDD family protein [Microbacterium sp.]
MPAAGPPSLVHVHQDEVLTGEAVALDVQPIGFFLRTLGAFIDVLVSVALIVTFALLFAMLSGQGLMSDATARIATIVMLVTVLIAIPTAVETAARGRSLGKLAVGGRIVRADGGASGFRQAFIRALVGVLEIYFTLGAIALLVGAFTPRSQRLGDLLAGTYSERTRTPPLPAPGFGVPPGLEPWAAIADVGRLPDRLARRIAQFTRQADRLEPGPRGRLAGQLAAEARPFVSPIPPVDPETMLRAVIAVRRDRELRGLELEAERVAALTAGTRAAPRDFPQR